MTTSSPTAAPELSLIAAGLRHGNEPGFVLDQSWTVRWANDAARSALPEPLHGRGLEERVHPTERARVRDRLTELEGSSGAFTMTIRSRTTEVGTLTVWREGTERGAWMSVGQSRLDSGLRLLHQIMHRGEQLGDEFAISWLLGAMAEFLGMEIGLVTRVAGSRLVVEHTYPSEVAHPGESFDMETSMCGVALAEGRKTTSIANVHAESHDDVQDALLSHAGREASAYVGRPLVVDGRVYGTLSFSSSQPRARGFRGHELELVQFAASWVQTRLGRSRTAAAASKETAQLEGLVRALPDPVVLTDTAFRILRVNGAFERLLGFTDHELQGLPVQNVVGVARLEGPRGPDHDPRSMVLEHRNGTRITRPTISAPVRDYQGRAVGYLFTVREPERRAAAVQLPPASAMATTLAK